MPTIVNVNRCGNNQPKDKTKQDQISDDNEEEEV